MKKLLNQGLEKVTAVWLKVRGKRHKDTASGQIEKELSLMNPGKDSGQLLHQYYQNKIKLLLILFSIGLALLVSTGIAQYKSSVIENQYYIARNDAGGGSRELSLTAKAEQEEYDMAVEVMERTLTRQETDQMFDEVITALPDMILDKNETLKQIVYPLKLVREVDGYPLSIRWESSHYEWMRDDGSYGIEEIGRNGETVTLHAVLSYEKSQKETDIQIILFPQIISAREQIIRRLEQGIADSQVDTGSKGYLELPKEVNGRPLQWEENRIPIIFPLMLLLFATLVGIFKGKDRDLHRQCLKRNEALLLEYPEFVSKLQLLTGSGMTLRGAYEKMGNDYRKRKREGGNKQYVYEEILLANRKMEGGLGEAGGYDFFGNRCGLQCYRKLSTLMIQNLKKGADGLHCALENEIKTAFEERKQNARKLGEEAGTRLLLPMMMQLAVVMIIIMIPAYLSFGGM